MKILKVKRTANSSFVTNRDLLECLQNNKSFVGSRENSNRLHSNHSKVSLLQKKNYDRMLTQENDSFAANVTPDFMPAPADRAIVLLQDCITTIGDSNQKLTHKLKKVIAYVRETQETQAKKQQIMKEAEREGDKALLRKLEMSCQQKAILKMQNEDLKAKLTKYRQKLTSLKKQKQCHPEVPGETIKTTPSLQKLVIYQSQVIEKQSEQGKREGEQLRRMLQTQALKIQQMLGREAKQRPMHSPIVLRF